MLTAVLELIFPGYCVVCQKATSSFVCHTCSAKLPWIKNHCLYCGYPAPLNLLNCKACRQRQLLFAKARSVFIYEKEIKTLIHNFKYNDQKWLAAHLAFHLAQLYQRTDPWQAEAVTWVPMTWLKKLARGYNQSELLAFNLAKLIQKPALKLLDKQLNTLEQSRLKGKQREENLRGAFTVNRKVKYLPNYVLLVDDVFTTGTTVAECCHVLKEAGVKRVEVLTVARTV